MPGFQPEINSKLKNGSETVSLDYGLIFKIKHTSLPALVALSATQGSQGMNSPCLLSYQSFSFSLEKLLEHQNNIPLSSLHVCLAVCSMI